jgi:hypothetical protein
MSFGDIILVLLCVTALVALYRFFFAAWRFRTFLLISLTLIVIIGGSALFVWWELKQMRENPYYKTKISDGQMYDLEGNPVKMNE